MPDVTTTTVISDAEKIAEAVAPNSESVQVAEDVAATVADPSILNITHDLELAHSLYKSIKARLAALPPSNHTRILDILKAIF